jgi:HSP20 family protein
MTLVKVNHNLHQSFNGMMNEILKDFSTPAPKSFRQNPLPQPPVNISENTAFYTIEIAAPGLTKEDFTIKVDGNILNVSSVKKDAAKDETIKLIRKEFIQSAVNRNFTIDDKIDAEKINAKYENGILKITLAKKEIVPAGTKTIAIA